MEKEEQQQTGTLLTYEQFQGLRETEQKQTLKDYRKLFTNDEIMKYWGINQYEYYNKLLKGLGIQTKNRKPVKKKQPTKQETKPAQKEESVTVNEPAPKPVAVPEGMNIQIKGVYDSGKIQAKLEKLALMLEDDTDYNIDIVVAEK